MDIKKLKRKKERARAEDNNEQLYHCCKDLGDEYLREENHKTALNEYREAEDLAKKLNNKMYVAIINRMIGETLCALGEFNKAIKHQKIHLQYSREEENLVEEQRALATLGRTYFVEAESFADSELMKRKESLRLSHEYYLNSLNICERLPLSNQLGQKTLSEMKSRLFLNLGLTSEAEGKTNTAVQYISKAIVICKNADLWDELCRCYTARGSIYSRQGITGKALTAYDEALKAAERVEKKVQIICEILSLKADTLIMLCDYNAAKQVLIKAYKMKTPDPKDKEEIKEKLKIVVLICRSENRLLEVPKTDYETRRTLNETLGDCCVRLKNFEKAVSYYESTLECATAMEVEGKELIPIYYSISQTYKDNHQYGLSIAYSRKELDLIKDSPAEACKTLLNITDTMELLREPFDKILASYKDCHLLAKKSGDFKIEVVVLKAMKRFQIEYGREDLAEDTESELITIRSFIPDSEEEFEDNDVDIPDDEVDLDELSDLYSDDEEEANNDGKPRRHVIKANIHKRNEKGESLLHIAAIQGNVDRIKSLIEQGLLVNVYDNAGWSPLHEACNHGQIEAARVLIELGANVNDRGGKCAEGLTPLLDAATNGNLEVIELLLDKGASLLAKANNGQTVLDCLLNYKERTYSSGEKFDYDYEVHFNRIVTHIKDYFSKAGQRFTKSCKTNFHLDKQTQNRDVDKSQNNDNFTMCVNSSRKRAETEIRKLSSSPGAAKEYKDAMQALRKRTKDVDYNEPVVKQKKSAFEDDDEVGDNWLEDDVKNLGRRTFKRRCEEFIGQQLRQPSNKNHSMKNHSFPVPTAFIEFDDDIDDLFSQIPEPVSLTNSCPSRLNDADDNVFPREILKEDRQKSCPKHQKSLLSMNFKRYHPSVSSTQETTTPRKQSSEPVPVQITQSSSNVQTIKVRIEGKLFLIPVPLLTNELNIRWLSTEASRRYQNSEGVSPALQLSTQDGALLDYNDPLSIILNASEICGAVTSWKLAPLVDSYKEACALENIEVDHYLKRKLDVCQANAFLEIRDRRLSHKIFSIIFKTIQHHQSLQQICVSGVFLNDQDMQVLVDFMSKLQIRSLNLSVNNVTNNGLSHLVQIISSGCLTSLEEVDVSYNPLGENCGQNLATLTQTLPFLRSLNLCCVGLTSECLYGSWNFALDHVEWLDISFNKLEREGISKFFAALNANKIRHMNVSSTGRSDVVRECILFLDRAHLDTLESLHLSGLDIDDEDVEQIVQSLQSALELTKLDLSNNLHISVRSQDHLSKLDRLKEIHLAGCDLLNDSNNMFLSMSQLSLSTNLSLPNFKEAPYSFVTNINNLSF